MSYRRSEIRVRLLYHYVCQRGLLNRRVALSPSSRYKVMNEGS